MKYRKLYGALSLAILLTLALGTVAYAQDGGPTTESQIDVIWLMLEAFLVFFMQAGFAMVESGFSRAKNKFVDITSTDDDLPWADVRKALEEIGYAGWATAEVGGGNVERLTQVRKQMQAAFGV